MRKPAIPYVGIWEVGKGADRRPRILETAAERIFFDGSGERLGAVGAGSLTLWDCSSSLGGMEIVGMHTSTNVNASYFDGGAWRWDPDVKSKHFQATNRRELYSIGDGTNKYEFYRSPTGKSLPDFRNWLQAGGLHVYLRELLTNRTGLILAHGRTFNESGFPEMFNIRVWRSPNLPLSEPLYFEREYLAEEWNEDGLSVLTSDVDKVIRRWSYYHNGVGCVCR